MYNMEGVFFELGDFKFNWDRKKAHANAKKHGISFEEAASVWLDPNSIELLDEEHSDSEDRWFKIGLSLRGALIVVWWTIRYQSDIEWIRLIGARKANRKENQLYEQEKN